MGENSVDSMSILDYVPSTFNMSQQTGQEMLRRLEFEAYEKVISVFRAQGPLSENKRLLLHDIRKTLRIPIERHKAEIRRVNNNEEILSISETISGTIYDEDWLIEGFRVSPILHRSIPLTSITRIANMFKLTNDSKDKKHFQFDYENIIDKQKLKKDIKKVLNKKPSEKNEIRPKLNPISERVVKTESPLKRDIPGENFRQRNQENIVKSVENLSVNIESNISLPQVSTPPHASNGPISKPNNRPTSISNVSGPPLVQPKPNPPKLQSNGIVSATSTNIIKINTSRLSGSTTTNKLLVVNSDQTSLNQNPSVTTPTTKIVSILPGNFSSTKQIKIVGVNNNNPASGQIIRTTQQNIVVTSLSNSPGVSNNSPHALKNLNSIEKISTSPSILHVNRIQTTQTSNNINNNNNHVKTLINIKNPVQVSRPQPSPALPHVVTTCQKSVIPQTASPLLASSFETNHSHPLVNNTSSSCTKNTTSEYELDLIDEAIIAAEKEMQAQMEKERLAQEQETALGVIQIQQPDLSKVPIKPELESPKKVKQEEEETQLNKILEKIQEESVQVVVNNSPSIQIPPVEQVTVKDEPPENDAKIKIDQAEFMHIEISKNHGGGYIQIPIPYNDCDLDAVTEDQDTTQIITYRYFKDNGQAASNITSMIPQFGGRFPTPNRKIVSGSNISTPNPLTPRLSKTPSVPNSLAIGLQSPTIQQQQQQPKTNNIKEESLPNSDQENQKMSIIDMAASSLDLKQIYDDSSNNSNNYISDSEPDNKRRRCYAPLF